MKKLIKLSDTRYIVVDDSPIKEGEWYLTFMNNEIAGEPRRCEDSSYSFGNCKKITHSTQPLEGRDYLWRPIVKPLSLSDVEEAIYGYSVEKMAQSAFTHPDFGKYKVGSIAYYNGYKDGFNAHKELTKDKLIGNDVGSLDNFLLNSNKYTQEEREIILQSICDWIESKTEWEVEFDEQGKIKLA
jgi:hypothetical protein